MAINRELGPGLLESVYEVILFHELQRRGFKVERQVAVPIEFRGIRFDEGCRLDLLVEGAVVVEIKPVEGLLPVHSKQVLTYLRLTGYPLGLLLNFNCELKKHGITRLVSGAPE